MSLEGRSTGKNYALVWTVKRSGVSKVIGFTDPLAHPVRGPTQLWLTAWAYHLIKSSPSCLVFRDGAAANQASWI